MAKKATKKSKVAKVSAETGVDIQDLERLPTEALDKLDALVPDEDLLSGQPELPRLATTDVDGSPIDNDLETMSSESTEDGLPTVELESMSLGHQELPKLPETQEVVSQEADVHGGERHILGYHPVTEEPVYK